jgi:hypothetical protein
MAVTVADVLMGGNDNNICNGNSGASGSNNCTCNSSGDGNDGSGNGGNNCMCHGHIGGSGSNNCTCNSSGDGNGGSGNGGNSCMCNGNSGGSGSNNCTCNSSGDDDGGGNGGGGGNGNCSNNAKSAQMDIDWGNAGTTAPFKALTAADLDLDVTNANIGGKHEIQTNPQTIDLKDFPADGLIAGSVPGMTVFAITGQHGRATSNFSSFADFEAALAADLNGSTSALRLTADGMYDAASNTFTAQRITILLSN